LLLPEPRLALTIRGRLLLFAAVMLVPFLLIVALGTYTGWGLAIERSLEEQEVRARQAAVQLEALVEQLRGLLAGAEAAVADDLGSNQRNDERLHRLWSNSSETIAGLSLLDVDGRMIAAATVNRARQADINLSDRDFFRAAIETRSFSIGAPVEARALRTWITGVARPILDANGKVLAVISAAVTLDHYDAALEAMRLSRDGVLVLATDKGSMLARSPRLPEWRGRDLSATPHMRVARSGGTFRGETEDVNGVRLYGASVPVRSAPWQVFVGVPVESALVTARAKLLESLLIALSMGLVAMAAAFPLARGLTQPIRQLQLGVNRLAGGALDHRVEVRGASELRELAADVNRMALALAESGKALRDERDRLDRRVAERTAELEALLREMQAFSYSVAHDLRSPLGVISGFAHVVAKEERERLSPDGKRLLGVIEANVAHLVELVDDLLTLAQVNRAEIARAPLDMRAIAGATLEEQRQKYPGTEIRLGEMPATEGDATLVRQVFSNLIDNALKYCSRVSAPLVEVGWNGAQRAYFVRDNGAGFDMRHARRMFGAFERLHDPGEFPGTGIGLAIVKRVIERHDGRVWVESAPGKGATFYFCLAA